MGRVSITHKIDQRGIRMMLQSPQGGLTKTMIVRAVKVTAEAKANLSRPPRRIDTGALRASIDWGLIYVNGYPGFRVGTNRKYGRYVHDGTGLHGPKRQLIKPRRARVLVFKSKTSGKNVFVKSVRGMKPNHFLADAMKAAKL